MLSAPNTARRISSLFNLKGNRDSAASSTSSGSPKLSPDNRLTADHRRARSQSRPAVRHASSPQPNSADARPRTSHGPIEPFDLDAPLPPPPSLLTVNQDLDDPSSQRSSHSRQGSASHNRRRSWMPSRASMSIPRQDMVATQPEPEDPHHGFDAWIAGLEQKIPYDLEALTRGDQVGGQTLKIMAFNTYVFQGP